MIDESSRKAATKAFRANVSPRYLRLENLENWSKGKQYAGLTKWFDSSSNVALWDRAPCVVYPVVKIAAQSNTDLLFGEGRFPTFTTKPGEDEDPEDGGLDPEDSAVLDKFIVKYHELCQFRSHCRDEFGSAQTTGTAVAIHGVHKNGKPFADLMPSKWCEPTLGPDGVVTKLVIQYPYLEEYKDKSDGKWKVRAKLFRRVIDEQSDTVYLPADAAEDGREPKWTEDKDSSVEHGLGFCPVVWYPFMRGCTPVNVIDGEAIHSLFTNEIHQHDIAISQRHRGALMSEPQICEIGVMPGYSPTELGPKPTIFSTVEGGEHYDPLNPDPNVHIKGAFVYGSAGGGEGARKKGPSFVWQYPSPDTKVMALTYPGDALKAQDDNCRDLRIKLQESLCVVFLDPENIKFAATTSGKALEAIKQKQIDRVSQFRDDVRDRFLVPSLMMQMRIAVKRGVEGLKVPGVKKALAVLAKLGEHGPDIKTVWGSFFKADPEEQSKIVAMTIAALGGKGGTPIVPLRVGLQRVAPIFGIDNVDAVMAELLKEREEREAKEQEKADAETERMHKLAGAVGAPNDTKSGAGSKGKPPKAPRGGSNGPGVASAKVKSGSVDGKP